MPPIFIVNGAPGAGKSTLSRALMQQYAFGLHIEVDALRQWVVSGIADPLDWTDETTHQFRLAEEAAIDLAIRYQDAGFAVAVDHCRRLEEWDEVLDRRCVGRPLIKIVVHCNLEENLERNRVRTNKDFDTAILERVIRDLVVRLPATIPARPSWRLISNEGEGIEPAVDAALDLAQ